MNGIQEVVGSTPIGSTIRLAACALMSVPMRLLGSILAALFFSSCAPQITRSAFLSENVHKISQEGIREAMGLPTSASVRDDGRHVWVYKVVTKGAPPRVNLPPPPVSSYGGGQPGAFPRSSQPELIPGTPSVCRQYTLIFDGSGVLREFSEADC